MDIKNVVDHINIYKLEDRYNMCNECCGSRSHHCFISNDNNNFKMRRISNDIIYTLIELVKTPIFNIIEYIMVCIFIGCRYDDLNYTDIIFEKSEYNCDVKVKFIKRNNQGEEYYS